MQRTQVKSSNLKSAGYSQRHQILQVEFHNGSLYNYSNVPYEVYMALMEADSIGKYFNANISNNPNYPYKKITKTL